MTNRLFLVDTTSWVFFFRKAKDPHTLKTQELVKKLEEKGMLVTCGMILAEFAQGLGKSRKEQEVRQILEKHEYLPSFKEIYILAGELSKKLMDRGVRIPLSDCLIAATAIFYKVTLVTDDPHFKRIPGLKLEFVE